jgi:hypothetical protein
VVVLLLLLLVVGQWLSPRIVHVDHTCHLFYVQLEHAFDLPMQRHGRGRTPAAGPRQAHAN